MSILVNATEHEGAFGVVSKNTNKKYASGERLAAGGLFPGYHGAIAGKKGKKLRAAGHEVAGAVVGSAVPGPGTVAGGMAGTAVAHRKGYYKKDRGTQRTGPLVKSASASAFGVTGAITKAAGDELRGTRGGVAPGYVAPASTTPPNVASIKSKLKPLKTAMVAAAKK